MKTKIILVLIAAVSLYAAIYIAKPSESQKAREITNNQVIKISSQEVDSLLEDESTFVLDVHTP